MIRAFVMFVAGVMVLSAQAITWQNRNGRSNRNSGNKTVHVSAKVGENTTPAQRLGFKIESTPGATNLTKKVIGKNVPKANARTKATATIASPSKTTLKPLTTSGKKK